MELIDKVAESIFKLFPEGDAWEGDKFYKIAKAASHEAERLYIKIDSLIKEIDPRTANILREDWLRYFPAKEYDGEKIQRKLSYKGGATPKYIEGDSSVVVKEQIPSYVSMFRMTEPLKGLEWHFVVVVDNVPTDSNGLDQSVVSEIEKKTPSHLKNIYYNDYQGWENTKRLVLQYVNNSFRNRTVNLINKNVNCEYLVELPHVSYLSLLNSEVKNYQFLSRLERIIYLNLSGTGLKDASFIRSFKIIKSLNLYNNLDLIDDNFIDDLPEDITSISISNTGIQSVEKFKRFMNIRSLGVSDTRMSNSDLKDILDLNPNLTGLYINNTEITDFSPLFSRSNIVKLAIAHNNVGDDQFRKICESNKNLSEIYAVNCNISNILPVVDLPIQKLYLRGNPIVSCPVTSNQVIKKACEEATS